MADKLLTTGMSGAPIRLIDNGDGSFSFAVRDVAGGAASRKQVWYKNRIAIPASNSVVLLEKTGLVEIDFLEFITHDLGNTENPGAYLKIELLQSGVWQNLTIMRNILNAYPHQKLTPYYLYENVSSMWVTNVHNVETNTYKYTLKNKLTAYEGIRISAMNDHTTDEKYLGVFFMGSEL